MPPSILAVSTDAQGVVTWCNSAVETLAGQPCAALVGRPFPLDVFERDQLEHRAAAAGVPCGAGLFLLDPSRFDRRRNPELQLGDFDRRRPRPAATPDRSAPDADRKADRDSDWMPGNSSCSWNVAGADGAARVVSLGVQPLIDEAGVVVGYFAQGIDVTEQHRTSRMLAQALFAEQEAARLHAELDQLRDNFVTTASHELRTPLTSILGFVELLETGVDDPERRQRFAAAIRRNVARLQHLAEGLVILSSTTDRVQSSEPLDLRDVVETVLARITRDAEPHRVVPELVSPEQPVEVLGVASRLELLVLHLVENAVKFTPPGGRVTVRVAEAAGEVTIEVSDTGPGVPASELPHLFAPFFRGAAAQEAAIPGTGLGLCIAAAVVEEHDGRLLVSENHPHGTVFTVSLPPAA